MISFNLNSVVGMKAVLAVMLLLASSLAPVAHAQSGPYSVRIENVTDYSIFEVHLSGPDLLGRRTLDPGYVFTAYVYAGHYDLTLVDEDGDVCVVRNVAVNGPTNWRITNSWLLNCEFR